MKEKREFKQLKFIFYLVIILQFQCLIFAQGNNELIFDRDTIVSTARNIIETARYCTLITLDSTGHPDARIMDPFSPDDEMIIWLGTNINSKKVKQIHNDLRVTLYYQAPNGVGYVVIKGQAFIVNDTLKKQTYWKNAWSRFYADPKTDYTLIKVVPEKLEIIDYLNGIKGDSETWAVPYVKFKTSK